MSRMNILSPAFIVTNFFTMRKSDRHLANIHHERHFVPLIRTRKPQWQPVNGTPCRSYDIQSAIPSPPTVPHTATCQMSRIQPASTIANSTVHRCTAGNRPPPAAPRTARPLRPGHHPASRPRTSRKSRRTRSAPSPPATRAVTPASSHQPTPAPSRRRPRCRRASQRSACAAIPHPAAFPSVPLIFFSPRPCIFIPRIL